jgi:GTP pyrophosphokinase
MNNQHLLDISEILACLPSGGQFYIARPVIERAYAVAEKAHAGKLRETGEPYIQHPLAVALLLTRTGMDADTIAAGLLHDVVEDTDVSLQDLAQAFGPQIANLVDGVTKLDQIEHERFGRLWEQEDEQRDAQEFRNLRKMFVAMANDVRVVVIKLADRLHNMRTLDGLEPKRRKSFARETLEIFAPLSSRLGVWQWKWELEDLSFCYLDPTTYDEIAAQIEEHRPKREASVQRHIKILEQKLAEDRIEAEISGRPKHIYSIYRKMQRKGVPFRQVYDARGIRVITRKIPDCYRALGIVHGLWNPIPGEFDDYIATPKDNGYQSLHTAVLGDDGKTLEVQIRTRKMHKIAERGIAAHWHYKEGGKRDQTLEAQIVWLRSLTEWRQEVPDAKEFIHAVKTDVFQDRVYTFTPKGNLIDLPAGATPIDFAYQVHTEIGHRCHGARVNGKFVSLNHQLKSGDQVEILTSRRGGPSRDWLNPALGYTQTSRARGKIRQWFRRQDREQNVLQGREIVERELKRLGLEQIGHEPISKLFGYEKLDDFHAAVGFGDVNSQQIVSKIAETRSREEKRLPFIPPPPVETVEGIRIQGTGGLLTRLARCCHPLPGDDVIGYVTRGRGVTVHCRDCPNLLHRRDEERLIEVSWGTRRHTVPVTIHVIAYDRLKLLNEISGIIGFEDINIAALKQDVQDDISTFYITIEINDIAQLSRILAKIERMPNVIEARRYTG